MIAISINEFNKLASFIKMHYGIYLREEKQALVSGRLHNVLIQNGFHNFSDYYDYIISDRTGDAVKTLVNKITTNYTYFMREADHFTFFKSQILPYLSNQSGNKDLRIWSAGCSSGEEPYTLAMIMDEYFGKDKNEWDTKILATDISSRALYDAVNGIYSNEKIETLPASWRLNYFQKDENGNFTVHNKIKNEVIYRFFNLMDTTYPFQKKFHVIFCRNVMIYFDNETKKELIKKFYNALEYGGYLFIGHSEALNRDEVNFKYVMPAVYRKV